MLETTDNEKLVTIILAKAKPPGTVLEPGLNHSCFFFFLSSNFLAKKIDLIYLPNDFPWLRNPWKKNFDLKIILKFLEDAISTLRC